MSDDSDSFSTASRSFSTPERSNPRTPSSRGSSHSYSSSYGSDIPEAVAILPGSSHHHQQHRHPQEQQKRAQSQQPHKNAVSRKHDSSSSGDSRSKSMTGSNSSASKGTRGAKARKMSHRGGDSGNFDSKKFARTHTAAAATTPVTRSEQAAAQPHQSHLHTQKQQQQQQQKPHTAGAAADRSHQLLELLVKPQPYVSNPSMAALGVPAAPGATQGQERATAAEIVFHGSDSNNSSSRGAAVAASVSMPASSSRPAYLPEHGAGALTHTSSLAHTKIYVDRDHTERKREQKQLRQREKQLEKQRGKAFAKNQSRAKLIHPAAGFRANLAEDLPDAQRHHDHHPSSSTRAESLSSSQQLRGQHSSHSSNHSYSSSNWPQLPGMQPRNTAETSSPVAPTAQTAQTATAPATTTTTTGPSRLPGISARGSPSEAPPAMHPQQQAQSQPGQSGGFSTMIPSPVRAKPKSKLVSVVVFYLNFVQFLFYRMLHLWEGSSRFARACVSQSHEALAIKWAYVIRYVTLPLVVWLTIETIYASLNDEQLRVRKYVYYSLAPSILRVIAAMWTSTIERQIAKDLEQDCYVISQTIVCFRLALGMDTGTRAQRETISSLLARTGSNALTSGTGTIRDFIVTRRPIFRRWRAITSYIERPINYGAQKLAFIIIASLFFWPNLFHGSIMVTVVARWVRVATVIILAPLNHWLGIQRVAGFEQIYTELLAIFESDIRGGSAAKSSKPLPERIAAAEDVLAQMQLHLNREISGVSDEFNSAIKTSVDDDMRSSNELVDFMREFHRWALRIQKAHTSLSGVLQAVRAEHKLELMPPP